MHLSRSETLNLHRSLSHVVASSFLRSDARLGRSWPERAAGTVTPY